MSKSVKKSPLVILASVIAIAASACSVNGGPAVPAVSGPSLTATQPDIVQSGSGSAWKAIAYGFPGASALTDITTGPDGNIWFTDYYGGSIGRIDMNGKVKRFATPTSASFPYAITAGPDGNVWFTEQGVANLVGRITPAGVITEYPVSINGTAYHPGNGIVTGPDHSLWFTTRNSVAIIRMAPNGVMTAFNEPDNCGGSRITVGPDGNLWYTSNCFDVVKLTTTGVFKQYALPNNEQGADIVAARDGFLYFTEAQDHNLGKVSTSGLVTLIPSPQFVYSRGLIAVGGQVWFAAEGAGLNEIGRLNVPSDTFATPLDPRPLKLKTCCAWNLANGPDGNVYFGIDDGYVGVYVAMAMKLTPRSATLTVNGTQTITVAEKKYGGSWTASSSDDLVASVSVGHSNDQFVVTAHGAGTCKITFEDIDGNSAVAKITVM